MSTALTLPGGNALVSKHSDDDFVDMAKSSEWLPRLQLFSSNSDACKEGKINIAHYGLVSGKDQLTDLGRNVNAYICNWRPKALLIEGPDGKPITYFDKESAEFKDIRSRSAIANSGALCGPEFLVFIPGHGFATFFMASKTARNEAPAVKALMGKPVIFSAKLIESGRYKWHGTTVIESSTPFDQPDQEDLAKVFEAFDNPPQSRVEVVPEGEASNNAASQERR